MKSYFQRELNYLRQAGRAFSKANPGAAPHLGEVSADPDVERLLEGFAFLTAQIQKQSDAWVPDLAQDLLHVVAPELQCITPSQTIVQFRVDRRRLRVASTVPCGFAMDIDNAQGQPCRFRTTQPCVIGSIDSFDAHLAAKGPHAHTLTIDAEVCSPAGVSSLSGTRTRVFVSGHVGEASNLLLAIIQHTKALTLTLDNQSVRLDPKLHLKHVPSQPPQPTGGHDPFTPASTMRVREYFSLPEASLFFDIVWPQALLAGCDASKLRMQLDLDGAHALTGHIPADVLKLHCVAATNLFEASAIPVRCTAFCGPQLLRAESVGNQQLQVYQVDKVEGICDTSFEKIPYRPYRDCHTSAAHAVAAYYHVQKRVAAKQAAYDTYISVHTPEDRAPEMRAQTLSIKLTCTNGSAPMGISANVPAKLLKPGAVQDAATVCAASAPLAAASGNCDTWILLGHMSSMRPGTDVALHMQKLLRILSSAFDAQSALARAHTHRIEGITKLEGKPGHQMHRGIATACETITMHLNVEAFTSMGDAYVFADIIDHMLADARGINQPHTLRVVMMPSQQIYAWPSRGMG
jgi:type VI secretion system protein ImpG